jgi:acyl-CoA thioester hydrolase
MIGGWLNLNSRKLTSLPLDLINQFEASFKTANYKVITSKDTRKWNKIPKDLIQ